jgi:hypothetical protein
MGLWLALLPKASRVKLMSEQASAPADEARSTGDPSQDVDAAVNDAATPTTGGKQPDSFFDTLARDCLSDGIFPIF